MLRNVADGVWVHQSEFMQTNGVVVQGRSGVLLIDPGVLSEEMACLARDLSGLGLGVVAGFSTHPHWDHLLWDSGLGEAPRYGTARCAETVRERLPDAAAKAGVTRFMPPEIVDQVPLDMLGLIDGLPAGAAHVPWDGPTVRIIEHQAHAPGHAALLIEDRRVLVAGDLISDILIPLLDFSGQGDPAEDYLVALGLVEEVVTEADVFIPGHGSVCTAEEAQARIERDRAYVRGLRDAEDLGDPRIGPHEQQRRRFAGGEADG